MSHEYVGYKVIFSLTLMMMLLNMASALTLVTLMTVADSANVLFVSPYPTQSHQTPFRALQLTMASKGHNVTAFTTHPIQNPPSNYKQIDLSFTVEEMRKGYSPKTVYHSHPFQLTRWIGNVMEAICNIQLNSTAVQNFIKKNRESFDVVVLENTAFQCYHGLLHQLGSPALVGVSMVAPMFPIIGSQSSPANPSYQPEFFTPYTDHMTFWLRLVNAVTVFATTLVWYRELLPKADLISRRFIGNDGPSVSEVDRNYSLLIVNQKACFNFPRPYGPNVIEVAELHVKKEKSPLPPELQNFLDGAEDNGAIYVSFGTQVQSSKLPQEKISVFLEVFSRIPQRILWKWETELLPGKPENVMVVKWAPQEDVLAHQNVRLFVTQGGAQSLQEAVFHTKPLLVIPFLADQPQNAAKVQSSGIGIHLDYYNISTDSLHWAIKSVLEDPSFRTNMNKMSSAFKDDPKTSLETAVWWIEYVIRHRGAPHLRGVSRDLPWLQQFYSADLFLGLTVLVVLIVTIALKVLRSCRCITVNLKNVGKD